MTDDDKIRRSQRWRAFYEEESGLRDMIAMIRSTYVARMSEIEPWETGKLSKLAIANKVAAQLDTLVLDIIGTGSVAEAAKRHHEKIEALPERKKRLLGYLTERTNGY